MKMGVPVQAFQWNMEGDLIAEARTK